MMFDPAQPPILLLRHGENQLNVNQRVARYEDAYLTWDGRRQVELLARRWTDRPRSVTSSPYCSARQTAAILRRADEPAATVDYRLAELRYLDAGFANGTARAERRERAQAFWTRCDPEFRDGPNSESFIEFISRIEAGCRALARKVGPVRLGVTHGIVIATALTLSETALRNPDEVMRRVWDDLSTNGVVSNATCVRLNLWYDS